MYKANPAIIQEAASDVTKGLSVLDGELGRINKGVSDLIANWDSAAQRAYQDRQTNWNKTAQNIRDALQNFVSVLGNVADNVSTTEQGNIGVVTGTNA